ncbi:hypothetical protein AQS8620_00209 [Aquimixticola soesokkakensis]|uniref:Uncharacterized protein n=1 Tax=Aquimixticola soesokkakensis TaxID=1519096 RepID=A0A1Y5RDZ2_9RHOB|nr:hypothetical protein [Aquimixticola soesokkakensis]SLN14031.1 hypothetical protein AQS8620_00209 [Aquimixticola soesokkakensis]
MTQTHKTALCCYCGTQSVLELRGTTRHSLSCGTCGAPINMMKHLRSDHAKASKRGHGAGTGAEHVSGAQDLKSALKAAKKAGKKKKRPTKARRFFDLAEDVFDLFD